MYTLSLMLNVAKSQTSIFNIIPSSFEWMKFLFTNLNCIKKNDRPRRDYDYFLSLLSESSIWFTEKHIIIYFFNTLKGAA